MGDLNFRVDLPDGEVRKLVENKDWAGMLVRDQVRFFLSHLPSLPFHPAPPRNWAIFLLLPMEGKCRLELI